MSEIRVDTFKAENGIGAPSFPNGIQVTGIVTATVLDTNVDVLNVTGGHVNVGTNIQLGDAGVVTATSYRGDGSQLTGIDATALKDSGGNVKIQAQASGSMFTGIHTFTGHTFHQDNDHSKFGTGGDMSIYHDNTHNYIDCEAGTLKIRLTGAADFIELQQDRDVWIKGNPKPWDNNTFDLGTASYRWRNIYTQDLQLSNEAKKDEGGNDVDGTWGDWTLQEGENDIFMINNRSGKKFKINLTEV